MNHFAICRSTLLFAGVGFVLWATLALSLTGCQGKASKKDDPETTETKNPEAAIKAARAQLSSDDRRLVEAQEFCPIREANRLGSHGKPFKVSIKDQPVFLCCDACEAKAVAEADDTLAKVQELKEIQAVRSKLPADERRLVELQDYCPVMADSRLGSMGAPLKITIKDQAVYLCCKGCLRRARANEDTTLAKVERLKAKQKAVSEKH
jgi:hypothetical protein